MFRLSESYLVSERMEHVSMQIAVLYTIREIEAIFSYSTPYI